MTIIYLTSHILESDFDARYGQVASMPNPAGENFHGKVLRALALVEDVHAYCLVPSVLGTFERSDFEHENIHYTYLYGPKNRYLRALLLSRSIARTIVANHQKDENPIILYDALSATLSLAASKVAKALNAPRLPILTDEIRNITGVTEDFCKRIHRLVEGSAGSIALTKGLVESYGLHDKPSYVQPAFVEEVVVEPKKEERPYIYYGGALFVKDGTKALIDAYKNLHPDYDLILAGHGNYENETKAASEEIPGIRFLGQISKQEHYAYIAGSALAINPRIYNPSLDALAVPSKVMEYLTYAPYIASTLSTPLQEEFGEAIDWIHGDLEAFLKAHLSKEGKLINLHPNDARNSILEKYGKQKSAFLLQRFLRNFQKK